MHSHGSVIFHDPDALQVSPVVRCASKRPLAKLLVEFMEGPIFGNDVHDGLACFVRWLSSQPEKAVTFSIGNLPGLPWAGEDFDYWAWYDRVMAEVAAWDPPPILVDVGCFSVTYRGEVLWPPESRRVRRRADRRTQPPGAPFPLGWYGQGLGGYRPCESTYDCYPPDELPPVPVPLTGTFDWLWAAPEHDGSVYQTTDAAGAATMALLPDVRRGSTPMGANRDRTAAALARLLASTPVALPTEFVTFFESPKLLRRIRSCTDCYFDLDTTAVEIRGGLGWLVRFASDSQGCLHWSLYLSPCRTKHAVVTTYFFTRGESSRVKNGTPHPRDITTCAASFEEFVYRFWLENELWFAMHGLGVMPVGGREYLAFYDAKTGPS